MLATVDLAPVTARLRRAGHLPAVLLADLPMGLTGVPAAIAGASAADDLDNALAAALAGLAGAPASPGDAVAAGARRLSPTTMSGPRPVPADRPASGVSLAPTGRTLSDLPGRAAGRGTRVHEAVGGPSRLVHHGASVAGVARRLPDGRAVAPVAAAPPSSSGEWTEAGAPARSEGAAPPSSSRPGPLRVTRDAATAELLRHLVAPATAATQATAARAGAASRERTSLSPVESGAPAAGRGAGPTARATMLAAGPPIVPAAAAPVGTAPLHHLVSPPSPRHGQPPERGAPATAPGDLAELVRWWGTAPSAEPDDVPAGRSPRLPGPVSGFIDGGDATLTADPLSTFRDALELVLLDEALGDGLEVG